MPRKTVEETARSLARRDACSIVTSLDNYMRLDRLRRNFGGAEEEALYTAAQEELVNTVTEVLMRAGDNVKFKLSTSALKHAHEYCAQLEVLSNPLEPISGMMNDTLLERMGRINRLNKLMGAALEAISDEVK